MRRHAELATRADEVMHPPHEGELTLQRERCFWLVANRVSLLPPSGLNFEAIAMASINVDFPLPFSPDVT